jgi:triacylglycerol lipase
VPLVPPEPFFSHPGQRILLEYNKRETSKSKWTEMRKTMFEVLMKMTGNLERIRGIGDNHKLHTKNKGYIARLIRDASRERRKPKN